jgi:DNA uptake protein ComE-like DNA-binding protein
MIETSQTVQKNVKTNVNNSLDVDSNRNRTTPEQHEKSGFSAYQAKNLLSDRNIIELNSADSVELLQLPGIVPVFAGRIIRYRKILGGFCSVDQLSEVYGMTPDKTERLEGLISVDKSLLTPIRLNFADYNLLSRHPYVRGNEAKKIIGWRAANGPYTEAAELLRNRILDSIQFRKLEPYLSCQ